MVINLRTKTSVLPENADFRINLGAKGEMADNITIIKITGVACACVSFARAFC